MSISVDEVLYKDMLDEDNVELIFPQSFIEAMDSIM